MTTIATDGISIAADGRSTWNEPGVSQHIHRNDRVKLVVEGDCIYALAGESSIRDALIVWHQKGAHPKAVPSCGSKRWTLLVVDRNEGRARATLFDDNSPYACDLALPFAMGTGESFALGAMDAGADPILAVRIAAKRDPFTGGDIIKWNIAEVLAKQKAQAA